MFHMAATEDHCGPALPFIGRVVSRVAGRHEPEACTAYAGTARLLYRAAFAGGGCHGRQIGDRMDRRDVEPGDGLHENHARLRQLLCGALRRTLARHSRPPLRAGLRSASLADAAGPAGALEKATHDLRQFDERPVPQGRAARLHRQGVRPDGDREPPHLPGLDPSAARSCAIT